LATERLGDLAGRRVLVLGAGDMGESMALGLAKAGVSDLAVANRTAERAEALAAAVGGRAVPLSELPEALASTDVLLTSTGAASPIVDLDRAREVMAVRDGRPLLIVDIAVP